MTLLPIVRIEEVSPANDRRCAGQVHPCEGSGHRWAPTVCGSCPRSCRRDGQGSGRVRPSRQWSSGPRGTARRGPGPAGSSQPGTGEQARTAGRPERDPPTRDVVDAPADRLRARLASLQVADVRTHVLVWLLRACNARELTLQPEPKKASLRTRSLRGHGWGRRDRAC